jgi:hypothetical protein
LPITLAILQKLTLISGDLGLRDNLNFDAAIKLVWAGLLRCVEFTVPDGQAFDPTVYLTRNSIEFIPSIEEPTHICLTLPSSKTDLFRKGVLVLIARAPFGGGPGSMCAVLVLQCLFHSDSQPALPCSQMVRVLLFLKNLLFPSLNIACQPLVSISPFMLVIVFIGVQQQLPQRLAIQTTRFNCLGAGAVTHTNLILMFLPLVFSTSHLASIWPLLLLQFLTLQFFILLLFWLELGLSHFHEEVM